MMVEMRGIQKIWSGFALLIHCYGTRYSDNINYQKIVHCSPSR